MARSRSIASRAFCGSVRIAVVDGGDDEPSLCGVTVTPGHDKDLEANLGSLDRQADQRRSLALPRIWCVEEL